MTEIVNGVDLQDERDMIIRVGHDCVWVWSSDELRVHLIYTDQTQRHLMFDENIVMAYPWSDDGLSALIADSEAGKIWPNIVG